MQRGRLRESARASARVRHRQRHRVKPSDWLTGYSPRSRCKLVGSGGEPPDRSNFRSRHVATSELRLRMSPPRVHVRRRRRQNFRRSGGKTVSLPRGWQTAPLVRNALQWRSHRVARLSRCCSTGRRVADAHRRVPRASVVRTRRASIIVSDHTSAPGSDRARCKRSMDADRGGWSVIEQHGLCCRPSPSAIASLRARPAKRGGDRSTRVNADAATIDNTSPRSSLACRERGQRCSTSDGASSCGTNVRRPRGTRNESSRAIAAWSCRRRWRRG